MQEDPVDEQHAALGHGLDGGCDGLVRRDVVNGATDPPVTTRPEWVEQLGAHPRIVVRVEVVALG